MAAIQDFMGQYNSCLQSASTAVQGSMQGLDSVSRGQSLFSPDGGRTDIAPVAFSVLFGIFLGMLVMWLILKKRSKTPAQEESK